MARKSSNKRGRIEDWEKGAAIIPDIEFICFELGRDQTVKFARGQLITEKKAYPLTWEANGYCYHRTKRIPQYDIRL